MIPYTKHEITAKDIEAVTLALQADVIVQGPKGNEFEQAVADRCGAGYGVAVNSGTSALHIACLAIGVGRGDLIWTTPNTFVATANCARFCGADIDFVDIDPRTYNLSPELLEKKLQAAAKKGRLPRVVIPVHFAGQPCEMEKIRKLSEQYEFVIIEDACHAVGAQYRDRPVGSCEYSEITVFSFHPAKIITTTEGGMALTQNAELAERMALLRTHCITHDPKKMTRPPDGPWYYQQIGLGFNYRMSEIQAALGLSQLSRIDQAVSIRHELAERYNSMLKDLPLVLPFQNKHCHSSYHLYVVRLPGDMNKLSQNDFFKAMRSEGIYIQKHYIPVHTQPYYTDLGFAPGDFPESEKYYEEAASLPLFHLMTEEEQDTVVGCLRRILS